MPIFSEADLSKTGPESILDDSNRRHVRESIGLSSQTGSPDLLETPQTPQEASQEVFGKNFIFFKKKKTKYKNFQKLLGRSGGSPGGLGRSGGPVGLGNAHRWSSWAYFPSPGSRSDPVLLRLGPKMAKKFKGNDMILKKMTEIPRISKVIFVFSRKMVGFCEK